MSKVQLDHKTSLTIIQIMIRINIVIFMLTIKQKLLHLELKQQFDHLEVLVIDPHQQSGPA